MCSLKFMGVFAIVPATVLLTISFFVLSTLRKADSPGLKAFGYATAVLLWISAAIIFGAGIYTMATGRHPAKYMKHRMMKGQMGQKEMAPQHMMKQ